MNWNCTLVEEKLSDFLEGTLSPEEFASFSAHRASCHECDEMVAQVTALAGSMRKVPAPAIPPHLVNKILDATLGPQPAKQGWRGWFAWTPAIWETRFAMGLGTVAASFLIVFHAAGGPPNEHQKVDLNPVHMAHAANRQAHLAYARGAKFVSDLRVVYQIESQLRPEPEIAPAPAPTPTEEQPAAPAMKQGTNPRTNPEPENKPDSKGRSSTIPPSTRDLEQSSPRENREQTGEAGRMLLAVSRNRRVNNPRSAS